MARSSTKKILIIYISIIAAVVLSQVIYDVNAHLEKVSNHQQTAILLEQDLKFTWDRLDEQLDDINSLLKSRALTNEDAGRLYERAALIYYSKGDTVTYFQYMGYALYYLRQSDDKDYTINVYLDLANFFLNNYSNTEAENMIKLAQEVRPFEEIESLQIKSYAYRMLGIMSILNLEYNDAETYFNNSLRIIEESNTNVFEDEYTAMTEVWLARVYEETGRLPKCKEIIDKWADSYMFTSNMYQNVFLRDFVIPYYQAKCYYLCADNIKERSNATEEEKNARAQAVIDYIHEFMDLCEKNHYEKAELYTLLKIQKEYPTRNEEIQLELYQVVNELYANIYLSQNKTYAYVIETIVSNSQGELLERDSEFAQTIRTAELVMLAIFVVSLLVVVFIIALLNNRIDGLTGLLNRKTFDSEIRRLVRSNTEYGIIMLDIDNFKNVNDSYGHPNGDIVIRRLGQLIAKETTAGVRGFRYGGEEFAIIIEKNHLPYVEKIADRVRNYMEQQGWEFDETLVITISAGASIGRGPKLVQLADDNLYLSKQTGKNKVTI